MALVCCVMCDWLIKVLLGLEFLVFSSFSGRPTFAVTTTPLRSLGQSAEGGVDGSGADV